MQEINKNTNNLIIPTAKIGTDISNIQRNLKKIVLIKDKQLIRQAIQEINVDIKEITNNLDVIKKHIETPKEKQIENELRNLILEWELVINDIMDLAFEDTNPQKIIELNTINSQYVSKMIDKRTELIELLINMNQQLEEKSLQTRKNSLLNVFLFFLGFCVLSILSYMLIMQNVAKQIDQFNRTMSNNIEKGILQKVTMTGHSEIATMADNFNTLVENLEKRNWLVNGINQLYALINKDLSYQKSSQLLIDFLYQYTDAIFGALYIRQDNNIYSLQVVNTRTEGELNINNIKPGEGIIGQAILNKKPVILQDIKKKNIIVKSGNIDIIPSTLCLYPLNYQNEVYGIIELGFTDKMNDIKLEFLKLAESIIIIHLLNIEQKENIIQKSQEITIKNEKLEQINQELELAHKHKNKFIAFLSHELKNPMSSILGFSSMLMSGCCGDITSEQKNFLERINNNARHLTDLINELLDISKIGKGKITLDINLHSPADIILEVCEEFSEKQHQKNISLKTQLSSELGYIPIDPKWFKQIISNLLSNAIKFTPPEGTIEISAEKLNTDTALFAVKDTGKGIPEHELVKIFDEFYQVETPDKKKQEGLGLGLALTKKLINLHGGEIFAESILNSGTKIYFNLPLK
jgi:signal transduction histidine kinase